MTKFKTCIETPASCILIEKELPQISLLVIKTCNDVEEVIFDIYQVIATVNTNINVENLINNEIDYNLINGKVILKEAITKHAELIVSLTSEVSELKNGQNGNFDVLNWNFENNVVFTPLETPSNMISLVNKLLLKITELESRIQILENI